MADIVRTEELGVIVRIDDLDVHLAEVIGCPDVFTAGGFELRKPRWVLDQEVATCSHCASAFSTLRRKHHCRQCGHIFCAKCCSEKLVLHQFALKSSERVCEQCKDVAWSVALTTSVKLPLKVKGVRELIHMLDTPPGLRKVLDSGGVQALVLATRLCDEPLRNLTCSAFNSLAVHTVLHPYLLKTGTGKAIIRTLVETSPQSADTHIACLSVLSLFCKSTQLLPEVQADGVLDPVLALVGATCPAVTQMALEVLAQLVEDPQSHPVILANRHGALSRIFRCTADQDEQTQEAALKMLALMALGNDVTRQTIAQEDIFSGHSTQRVLCSWPRNIQVLSNAACLVANMAASEQTQGALKDLLLPLCRLIDNQTCHQELMLHTARGIANFARNQNHAQLLIPYVSNIFHHFVKSVDTLVRYQGLRTMVSLMTFFPQQTLVVLQQNEIIEVFKVMSERLEIMHAIHTAILEVVSCESKP